LIECVRFQTFDAVLVSDVTAMARPFLEQPLFVKPLFIWVCNRFDFANQDHEFVLAHTDMLQYGYFPDAQYYARIRKSPLHAVLYIVKCTRALTVEDFCKEEQILVQEAIR
jgi:hypothetical protein